MRISQVKVTLAARAPTDRLRAYASIVFDDCFAVHDLKLIEGPRGLFVAMPSRARVQRCTRCGHKNALRARFCQHCGLADAGAETDHEFDHDFIDVAHPIHAGFRETIEAAVFEAYRHEQLLQADAAAPALAPRDSSSRENEEAPREERSLNAGESV
jgi:stage V sporulation protein G